MEDEQVGTGGDHAATRGVKAKRELAALFGRCVSLLVDHAESSGLSETTTSDSRSYLELEQELGIYIQCLVDLTCLEYPAPDPQVLEPYVAHRELSSCIGVLVQPWCRRIFDVFLSVDVTLAERLGTLNWNRFEELRKWASELDPDDDPQGHLTSTLASTDSSHTFSTGIGNTTDTGLTVPDSSGEIETGFEFGLPKGTR